MEKDIGKEIENYENKCRILGIEPPLVIKNRNGKAILVRTIEDTEEVVIPSFVEEIGVETFKMSKKIRRILGIGIKVIRDEAFRWCDKLEEIDFPNLEVIGEDAFVNSNIRRLDFKKLREIGEGAFQQCEELIEVNLPELETIGEWAFLNCGSLQEANLPKLKILSEYSLLGCINLRKLNIPSVNKVKEAATDKCDNLEIGGIQYHKYVQVMERNPPFGK